MPTCPVQHNWHTIFHEKKKKSLFLSIKVIPFLIGPRTFQCPLGGNGGGGVKKSKNLDKKKKKKKSSIYLWISSEII